MSNPRDRLERVLRQHNRLAVAVSGGIDSLTLAYCAARWVPDVLCIHAVSPAVPAEATARVRDYAARERWPVRIVQSGEFADARYRANPHNRCYFCKTNLYAVMAVEFSGPIASGTNTDDLGDYRPGLIAAREHSVVHPFVEAGIDKQAVRALARGFGLDDIAELPAQPCLASRIQTGIAISPGDLAFVHQVEKTLRLYVPGANLRCRVLPDGIRIETDQPLPAPGHTRAKELCEADGRQLVNISDYTRGSAFLVPD